MNKRILGLAMLGTMLGIMFASAVFAGMPTPQELPEWTATEVLALVTRITNWIFTLLIAIVVIMVLVAGYLFVTGGGNPDQVGKARQILMYAMIGFVIAMIARGVIAIVGAIIGETMPEWEW